MILRCDDMGANKGFNDFILDFSQKIWYSKSKCILKGILVATNEVK
jgi:hypothetical protein